MVTSECCDLRHAICSDTGVTTHDADDSVIFVNENENENGEKRENNEFVNEN